MESPAPPPAWVPPPSPPPSAPMDMSANVAAYSAWNAADDTPAAKVAAVAPVAPVEATSSVSASSDYEKLLFGNDAATPSYRAWTADEPKAAVAPAEPVMATSPFDHSNTDSSNYYEKMLSGDSAPTPSYSSSFDSAPTPQKPVDEVMPMAKSEAVATPVFRADDLMDAFDDSASAAPVRALVTPVADSPVMPMRAVAEAPKKGKNGDEDSIARMRRLFNENSLLQTKKRHMVSIKLYRGH